jgi:hypothetical protein
MVVDQFGITQLFATKSGAREWFSKWANGHTRVMKRTGFTSYLTPPQTNSTEYNVDPDDSELIDMADGPSYLYIDGAGVLTHTQAPSTSGISSEGNDMRLTVCDYKPGANSYDIANEVPARKTWTNVEVTIYARALTESFGGTGGSMRLAGRSNHFNYRYCLCDAGGYDFQLHRKITSSTGVLRVDKEMIHDTYTTPKTGYSHFDTCSPYYRGDTSGGVFPMNRWVGMKLVLRTITSLGHVNIQGYRDLDNGLDGGKWVKMVEWTDTGVIGEWGATNAGRQAQLDAFWADNGCGTPAEGLPNRCIDTAAPYLNYNPVYLRAGYACYFRTDHIDKMQLKKFSVREIDPL